ncbi:hypothetical protein Y1Q_0013505 [Alligator mississippiensis]|uniref:Uncharacterized protein n=1 Tax=Alligator mississippiensis TaxID=8496 RepID=A0A151P388_ALLMI|nr:hypothetical protein Y1Q_0013505 [Alligator mississippiensis]
MSGVLWPHPKRGLVQSTERRSLSGAADVVSIDELAGCGCWQTLNHLLWRSVLTTITTQLGSTLDNVRSSNILI